jgi:transcriptional repressor NrdR
MKENPSASRMCLVNCPSCHSPTRVLESRRATDGAAVRRRRQCARCGHRFTTFERREPEPRYVIKRDGERQRFDRAKLHAALVKAAHKRPVDAADIEAIVDRVELAAEGTRGELSSERIGELCLEELSGIDRGAYLQFAGTLPSISREAAASEPAPVAAGSVRTAREDPEFT